MNKKKKLTKLIKKPSPNVVKLDSYDPTQKIFSDTVRTSVRFPKPVLVKLKAILEKKNASNPVNLSLNSILVHSAIKYIKEHEQV